MARNMNYVCDRCGLYFVHEQASMLECPNAECQSMTLWEFERKDAALQHARHIRRGIDSGLFRPSPRSRSIRHVPGAA